MFKKDYIDKIIAKEKVVFKNDKEKEEYIKRLKRLTVKELQDRMGEKEKKVGDEILNPMRNIKDETPAKIEQKIILGTAKSFYATNVILARLLEDMCPSLIGYSKELEKSATIMVHQYKELIEYERKRGNNIAIDPRFGFIMQNAIIAGSCYMKNARIKKKD